ncbi:AsmA-like C-terminal region-containing protein [Mesorhizobium sp. UC22_110]|uniref:AsmA family protein n=1 Tax=unclassified Mesorhizobium TaxID=325217 RepID=UPI0036720484
MLARLFVIFGGLFVLALLAALVVPPFVDWTGYRADFEREASTILGRKVTVKGSATARLLPFPSVTFTDVSVAGGAGGEPAMTVETFSMDAELAPFLRGEVLIFDMRLVRPKAIISVAADGKVDWTARPSSPFDPAQVAIEKLTVTDGAVELRQEASGRLTTLSNINATVSAKSLAGPWRAEGALKADGIATRLSLTTGKADGAGKIALRIKAEPDGYPLSVEADGNAGVENGQALYSGQFKLLGDNGAQARPAKTDGGPTGAKAPPTYRLNGKFQLDHRKLAIDEFRLETGPLDNPYTADGKALVDLGADPRFTIEASGAQVQFEETPGKEGTAALPQRIAALERVLLALPKPAMPGSVEVKLPAMVAGDTTIRDVVVSAEPATGGWAVKSLAATLPGRTTLEANGRLDVDGEVRFTGSLLLAVAQPSGFAAWLSQDVDEAIRRLPTAGFSAKVDLTDVRQKFDDLELVLGKASFHGSLDASQPAEGKPTVVTRLEGGALDVEGLTAFAALFMSDKGINRFADADLDAAIKAGPVDAWGFSAETLDTAMRLRTGMLEIDKLSIGGLEGASISATGRMKDFPKGPTGSLDASLLAPDLAPLIDAAAKRFPDSRLLTTLSERGKAYPGLYRETRLDVVTSTADNGDGTTGLALSGKGTTGGSALSVSLSAHGQPGEMAKAPFSLTFDAKNPDAAALLALYGLPALPLGMVGEATTDITARGTLVEGVATAFNLWGPDLRARFDGTVTDTPQGLAAKGKVALDTADIEPWLMTTGVALPGMGFGAPVALAAEADYRNSRLAISGLKGSAAGTALSGDVAAEFDAAKPHLSGQLALDTLDLHPLAAMLFGNDALSGDGTNWPKTPFAAKPMLTMTADLDLAVVKLLAGPLITADDAMLSLKLVDEGLGISKLKAKVFGGEITGLFDLKNNDGTGLLSGQATLAGTDLSRLLPASGLSGAGTFIASATTSGKSIDAMVSSLAGSGTASLRGVTVANLNADALPALLAKADGVGRDIDAPRTAAFAPGIAGQGSFVARDADIAFTLAAGVLRAPPMNFETPTSSLSAEVSADLAAGTVAARGTVTYKAGDEALIGSDPALNYSVDGPIDAPVRSFDSAPLAQFLTQRALEKEQQRVEAMQAVLLEKQRLRREARYYADLQEQRDRAEEEKRRIEEEKRKSEEAARLKAENEAKAAAEARAKVEAEEKARTEKAAAEAAEAERRKAEAAIRAAQEEKAKLDAERQATPPTPAVPSAPAGKLQPFSIQDFLKTLQ